ncbi:MAG: hypothetical protein AAF628_19460 [Planctomycetota bacterium]
MPIPDDRALLGTTLCVQGGSLVATSMPILTNALDITIGCF